MQGEIKYRHAPAYCNENFKLPCRAKNVLKSDALGCRMDRGILTSKRLRLGTFLGHCGPTSAQNNPFKHPLKMQRKKMTVWLFLQLGGRKVEKPVKAGRQEGRKAGRQAGHIYSVNRQSHGSN